MSDIDELIENVEIASKNMTLALLHGKSIDINEIQLNVAKDALKSEIARMQAELDAEREKHGWTPYVLHVQTVDKMPSKGSGFYPIMSYGKPSFQYWDDEGKRFEGDIRVDYFTDIILSDLPWPMEEEE